MKIDIILRTCSSVHAFSGPARLNNFTKKEVIGNCVRSLARSIIVAKSAMKIQETVHLHIVDDHSDDEGLRIIHEATDKLYPTYVPIVGTGNAASIKTCYDYAISNNLEHIYFVEDDYLHESTAIFKMFQIYKNIIKRMPVVVHPYDCPDRYTRPNESKNCQLFFDADSCHHWRTIDKTTGTFLVSLGTMVQHEEEYYKFAQYGVTAGITEDNSINLVYKDTPCISPIPTLATHLQYESTIPLGYDWYKLWYHPEK